MATYYYLGTYINDLSQPNNPWLGYPQQLSTYNPFTTDPTIPLTINNVANDAAVMEGLSLDNVDRSPYAGNFSFRMTTAPTAALVIYVGGGRAGFSNAFGIGVTSSLSSVPLLRYIVVPNLKGTPDGLPPSGAPNDYVQSSLALPIPSSLTHPTQFIGTPDPNNVFTADPTAISYTGGQGLSVVPFVLPNAWRFDGSYGWYVDTTVDPLWSYAPFNTSDGNTQHAAVFETDTEVLPPSNVTVPSSYFVTGYYGRVGMEDFSRTVDQATLNPTTLNVDFNDVVFTFVTVSNIISSIAAAAPLPL